MTLQTTSKGEIIMYDKRALESAKMAVCHTKDGRYVVVKNRCGELNSTITHDQLEFYRCAWGSDLYEYDERGI